MKDPTRRRLIRTAGICGVTGLAGCVSAPDQETPRTGVGDDDAAALGENGDETDDARDSETGSSGEESNGPPTAERDLPEDYSIDELMSAAQSGGPPPDGIPSIDDPSFDDPDDSSANLSDQSPVFGVEMDGEAKAYPQHILVWHEIVNDVIAGQSVSVTYCPLTGTAQGFYRGDTTFGVSGQLINTNLVMFDRATESWWPQMLARGIDGPFEGEYLEEFQVIWTTWERWREDHPDTVVLNESTGYARDYGRDPYGSYNPREGYYSDDSMLFPALTTDDRFEPKDVVIGARTSDGAMCVPKETLRAEERIEGTVNGTPYVSVYDPRLDTGYVYRNPDDLEVQDSDLLLEVEGSAYEPDELPLERVIAYDAMWVAWYGYYPSTQVHT